MGRLFGTDGVRGVFGRDLTTELARWIGRAAVTVLARDRHVAPTFVIGRDTRAPRARSSRTRSWTASSPVATRCPRWSRPRREWRTLCRPSSRSSPAW